MQIRTLHIRGYRHLHDVVIHELGEINVFAGPNNSGKTSILRAVRETVSFVHESGHKHSHPTGPFVDFGVVAESLDSRAPSCSVGPLLTEQPGDKFAWAHADKLQAWGPSEALYRLHVVESKGVGLIKSGPLPLMTEWDPFRKIHVQKYIIDPKSLKSELANWLQHSFFLWHRRKSEYVDKLKRQDALDPDAVHLAARLHQLRGEKPRAFHERLEQFINAVIPELGEPTTHPTEDGNVEIRFGGYSLESLGGGVEQVLVLAMILLGETDQGFLFLEEPESHLHPDAQHRLIEQILAHRGQRQIFLTTHSPVFLNGFGAQADVFRVTREDGKARVERSLDRGHQRHVLDDLGVRPSSLLQSNCVLWVEGPTEHVLIRHWLSLVDEELREQRHYDFAYTGGSLLAHLGVDVEPALQDLRDLFRVCRYNYVLCDRDAGPDDEPAKPDVQRIQGLRSDHLGLWVTHAYEIEWYFPLDLITELWNADVAKKVSENPAARAKPFYEALSETGVRGTASAGTRKVEYARRAVQWKPDGSSPAVAWFQGDLGQKLRKHVEELAAFIRRANGLPHPE